MERMGLPFPTIRGRLDRAGVLLSSLCAVHCVLGIVIVAGVAIGIGALQHRRALPFVVAMTGLTFMGGGLAVDHGVEEAVLTIIGVTLVAAGHMLNLRRR
jgi:hypothetical protein